MKDDLGLTAWANSELQSVEDELNKTKRERDDALRDVVQAQKEKFKAEHAVIAAQENEAEVRQQLASTKNLSQAETRRLRQDAEAASAAREGAERKPEEGAHLPVHPRRHQSGRRAGPRPWTCRSSTSPTDIHCGRKGLMMAVHRPRSPAARQPYFP